MKTFSILFVVILMVPGILNAQKKNKTKEIAKELFGIYEGHQPEYAMRNGDGEEMVIGGKKVWVPACNYKFELRTKNKVSMSELSVEKSKPNIYTGTYKIVKEDADQVEIFCKVTFNKNSNPEYTIVINKKDKTAVCFGQNQPVITLTKIK